MMRAILGSIARHSYVHILGKLNNYQSPIWTVNVCPVYPVWSKKVFTELSAKILLHANIDCTMLLITFYPTNTTLAKVLNNFIVGV